MQGREVYMENLDIRLMLHDKQIQQKAVAVTMGIRADSLSRMLSKPLTPMQRERVLYAIRALEQRGADNEH